MPDRETISRIAKILARATNSNEHESAQAIKSAYARMKRDGVTFEDLLSLPAEELEQSALNKLLDHILADDTSLSPKERRDRYSEFSLIIALKFAGVEPNTAKAQSESRHQTKDEEASRKEQARRYRERNEQTGSQNKAEQGSQQSAQSDRAEQKTQDQQTQNAKTGDTVRTFNFFGKTFSFSPATFFSGMSEAFGRGSFFHSCLSRPISGLHLLFASFIFGIIAAMLFVMVIGLVYATISFPVPNLSFTNAFAAIATFFIAIKARHLYLAGWFD